MSHRRISLPWIVGILVAWSVLLYGCGGSDKTPDPASEPLPDLYQTEAAAAPAPTHTVIATWTPAPTHTIIPTWTPSPPPTSTAPSVTWYVSGAENANVRACGSADCEVVDTLAYGDQIQVISTANGWHEIRLTNGTIAYIAEWLTSQTRPSAQTVPTAAPVQVQPTAPPSYTWDCSGNRYDCSDFSSCDQAKDYLRSCPGDPSNMDGDGDGIPCERGVCSW